MQIMTKGTARKQFLLWVKKEFPAVYDRLMKSVKNSNMDGLGDLWESIADTANKILPSLVQAKAQRDIFKAQLKRAEQGMPPLKTEEIAPTLKVKADVGQKWLLPALLGGGALAFMFLQRKR